MAGKAKTDKLRQWQERLGTAEAAYSGQLAKMDAREDLYRGENKITPLTREGRINETSHVRNIVSELVESQVDSAIPQPKVTARRPEDERMAKIIEDMIRNELDRLPMESINDMQARTVPIQGGGLYLIEWDNTIRTHDRAGEICLSALHPKQIIPQDGVYSGIADMDYVILKVPQTKGYIGRRYGVDVEDMGETEPEIKGATDVSTAEDMVTQYIAYYRNDEGGIGLYSWVGDTQLEDLEDYQARRAKRCAVCGEAEPAEDVEPLGVQTLDGLYPEFGGMQMAVPDKGACKYCGSDKWEDAPQEYEEIYRPILRTDGSMIPGAQMEVRWDEGMDAEGKPIEIQVMEQIPTRVPYYKPDIYPVILQKNVSIFGQFLGDSDIDKIRSQQNTTNRISQKIIDKLLTSGSYMTLPVDAKIARNEQEMKYIPIGNPADKNLIEVFDMEGNISQDMQYLAQVYEEARQIIGITDSFQGRSDRTATSGKAKEFAAAQSAGRLESKRRMKDAAYAELFEAIFKFHLAYADEPRTVVSQNTRGERVYDTFNRYDFLQQDESGEWYWNDQFLFACDNTAPLAGNREAMWQETRMNLQTGAYGDPANPETLILFWSKMELLHYPGAADTKAYLEEQLERARQQQQAMAQEQAMAQPGGMPPGMDQTQAQGMGQGGEIPPEVASQVIASARQAAARDRGMR